VIINNIDELYQSMHDLLVDENKRILFGENAQRRSHENFQWNTVTKKYKSIFDKVVNNS
jgi:glycosyltransferase involved in cell wall biosynthesis